MRQQIEGFRLSPQQERLWELLYGRGVYRAQCGVTIEGELDQQTLRRALETLTDRHEILRTVFCGLADLKNPVQVITERSAPTWQEFDLRGQVRTRQTDFVDDLFRLEPAQSFDYQRGPLLQAVLVRLENDLHLLLLALAPMCADSRSLTNLLEEIVEIYSADPEILERDDEIIQYIQFSEWQHDLIEEASVDPEAAPLPWRNANFSERLRVRLPFERRGAGIFEFEPASAAIAIPPSLITQIDDLVERHGVAVSSFFLAGWLIHLRRLIGEDELVVGVSSDGRSYPGLKRAIGLYAKCLPLLYRVTDGKRFTELLEEVDQQVDDLLKWQEYFVWEQLTGAEPERERLHYFPFCFEDEGRTVKHRVDGMRFSITKRVACVDRFKVKLSCRRDDGALVAELHYDKSLFEREEIERLADQYRELICSVIKSPGETIGDFNLLSVAARDQLLVEFAPGKTTTRSNACIHRVIEAQVERTPDRVSVVFEDGMLTFGALNGRANSLARRLVRLGVGPEQIVAICLERSMEVIVGMLAILKAGGAYLPLDPSMPSERLAYMIEDSQAVALLTHEETAKALTLNNVHKLCLDADIFDQKDDKDLSDGPIPENLLCVIYTSGSTGRPKGVAIEHRQLFNYLTGIEERLALNGAEKFALVSTFAADLGNTVIYPALCGGGSLHIISRERAGDPEALADYFRRHEIDCLKIVPSHFAAALRAADPGAVVPHRRLILGGEACDWELIDRAQTLKPECSIINHYGPTETTVGVLTYQADRRQAAESAGTAPLGRPLDNDQIYVLDRQLKPLPVWIAGELFISGASLARGYLQRPEGAAERFLPNPFSSEPGAQMYRTGDVARFQSDGNVEFLGRVDHQVKLRGYRIELGEIEHALKGHPSVEEAIALVREDEPGDKRLVAYVTANNGMSNRLSELRSYLRDRLPDYMSPSAIVPLRALPLTPNGKIDRHALPAPEDAEPGRRGSSFAPRTPLEEVLMGIWTALLRTKDLGIYDSFFEVGGHSLLATKMISRIRQACNVEAPLRLLFENPTIARLAARIESMGRGGSWESMPIAPAPRDKALPLSFAQQRLWFIDQLMPHSPAYNVPKVAPIKGILAISALEQGLTEVVRRHEALRTRFDLFDGQPRQVIERPGPIAIPFIDLSRLTTERQQFIGRRLAMEEANRPFDLRRGPVWRVSLLHFGGVEHVALLTMHHIISDAWSSKLFSDEISAIYEAYGQGRRSPLTDLSIQFADYAVWQRGWLEGDVMREGLNYWRKQLTGSPPLLDMPADRPRPPVQSFHAASQRLALSEPLTQSLKQLSGEETVTLFMTLLAAFTTLLFRHSNQEDIVVGVPVAGRNRAEVESLIGFFINTLAMRTDLTGAPTFRELLKRVRARVLEAYTHQEVPFERLVEDLDPDRSLSHTPLFQVVFMFDNTLKEPEEANPQPVAESGWSGAVTESWTAKFDLTLSMVERNGRILGMLKYAIDLFNGDRIGRMLRHFEGLLESVANDPDQKISEIDLLSVAERQQLLLEWNDTQEVYLPDQTLDGLFERQSRQFPERVAVVYEDSHLSYGELERRARILARFLRKTGLGPDEIVALCLERSLEMVIGVLGVHMAGGAYVPLDPSYPLERLAFMLADTRARVVLTQQRLLSTLPAHAALALCLDAEWKTIDQSGPGRQVPERPEIYAGPENLAYVIYTSGSTGLPKGAAISRRGICNRLFWGQSVYQLTAADRVLHEASFSFDFSVWEIYGPLMAGARMILVRPGGQHDPGYLADIIARQRVTVIHFVPSMLQTLIDELDHHRCASLRLVFCGGEELPPELESRLTNQLPASVYNQYGATEASINSTYWICPTGRSAGTVPVGRPLANTQVYALNEGMLQTPVGVAGEVYIGGVGLARGYHERPGLSAEKFIPDPFSQTPGARLYRTGDLACYRADGALDFIGRKDHQVKIRGYRIEPGEIEAAIKRHPSVREAVVIPREDGPGNKRLVAYVVLDQDQPLDMSELRQSLRDQTPEYMLPAAFVALESLPLTPNGKLDRRALPAPNQERPDLAGDDSSPRTLTEELLSNIWTEVLGIERIGREDNFFDLGGHSLLATQVMSRVRKAFQVEAPLQHLFESPTIAELATVIEKNRREGRTPPPAIESSPRTEDLPLSFAQQRLWFLDQLAPNSSTYNMRNAARLEGGLATAALEQAIGEVVRRHEVLRTRYVEKQGQPTQIIDRATTFNLPLVDLSGLNANGQKAQSNVVAGRLAAREASRSIDLAQGPILRARLLRLDAENHVLLLTIHHIASDAWSMRLFSKEAAAAYDAFGRGVVSPLQKLPIQYADFAAWQRKWLRGAALASEVQYWRDHLGSAPPVLEMPLDRPRPAIQSFRGAHCSSTLSTDVTSALRTLSRAEDATLFMALLAAFKTIFSRLTGQTDIVLGTPIAGRNHAEIENLIGFFINTLVLRTDLSGDPSFRELLGRVRSVLLGAYTHQDLPFEKLVEILQPQRDLSRTPLFQVFFNMINLSGDRRPHEASQPDESSHWTIETESKFDLTLYVLEQSERIQLQLVYNADLFEPGRMMIMLEQFGQLLNEIAAHPDERIGTYSLTLSNWLNVLPDPGSKLEAVWEESVYERLSRLAKRDPNRLALVEGKGRWTYGELDRQSNRLAHCLRSAGIGRGNIVAIYAARSASLVYALLGALKTGAAFLILDAAYPPLRLIERLRQARPSGWIELAAAGEPPAAICDFVNQSEVGCRLQIPTRLSELRDDFLVEYPDVDPGVRVGPRDIAYVAFTSGSTGESKGIIGEHHPLAQFMEWERETFDLGAEDRFSMLSGLSHDPLLRDVFAPLWIGAALCVADAADYESPPRLIQWMKEYGVTIAHLTPALGQLLTSAMPAEIDDTNGPLTSLRFAFFGGDVLTRSAAARLRRLAPTVTCVNFYGATETPQAVSYHVLSDQASDLVTLPAKEAVSLGQGTKTAQLLVLNSGLGLAGLGEVGEIYVRSPLLARGYLNDEELTLNRFIVNPYTGVPHDRLYRTGDLGLYHRDGSVEFRGRRDGQVKIRGFRIEVEEIEALLRSHSGVRETAVTAAEDRLGDKRLVAYIVSSQGAAPSPRELRIFLQERLPDYMAPSGFVYVERLALTPNGKVDRRALPAPDKSGFAIEGEYQPPRTPVEEALVGIWSEVLDLERIGVEQNFFELGGHSLLATQVMSRVRQAFQVELPLPRLFESPTIKALAESIESEIRRGHSQKAPPAITPVGRRQAHPLSFAQWRLWFLDQMAPGNPAYNVHKALHLQGPLSVSALEQSLTEVVRRHEALRTRFGNHDGEPVQVIEEAAPYSALLVDLSRLNDRAREQEMRKLADLEAVRPFDLTCQPLMRAGLVRLDEANHALLLTTHHIVCDGWSSALMRRELTVLYESFCHGAVSPLPELAIQYADYAVWQRQWLQGEALDEQLSYWKQQLRNLRPLELPTDFPTPAVQTFRGRREYLALPESLSAPLKEMSRRLGTTLFMTLLAGFKALLHRYVGQQDIIVGTGIANRNRAEIEGLIGFFVNMLVLRTDLSGNPSFRELLGRVQKATLGAYAHQDLPYEKLVEEIQPEWDLSHAPLFQAAFFLQNIPHASLQMSNLTQTPLPLETGTTHFNLTLFMMETKQGLIGAMEYNSDLFEAATITQMLDHYKLLLEAMAADSERRLLDIPLLRGEKRVSTTQSILQAKYAVEQFDL